MSKHHFLVMFDSETKNWEWDAETETAKFPDGTIWDDEKQEWYSGYLGDGGYDPIDDKISEYFPTVIETLDRLHALSEEG
jgi:hypothetical protein